MPDLIDARAINVDPFAIVTDRLEGSITLVRLAEAGRYRHGGALLYFRGRQIDTGLKGVSYVYDDETNASHLEYWGGYEDRILARFASKDDAVKALHDGLAARAEVDILVKQAQAMLQALTDLRDRRFKETVQAQERDGVQRDGCEVCNGSRGGVPGNENVVDGKVVCDYCHVDIMDARKG
ncbi:hypothetical protein D869_gp176 [Caulobacter phage CcrRogue]|uniref:Uncharacterized protein n=1 Tax=Caulobacter phage CcrRogue TaxID=2927986 RepID=K4JSL5_9CAUD|nr:hypothetical protein D869_gp176 [Caulobacter phage CcrRogue]AFU86738.1 hypothetical protein CcrRogue_gp256 [Caulobacter phage CcrRogue]